MITLLMAVYAYTFYLASGIVVCDLEYLNLDLNLIITVMLQTIIITMKE